MMRIVGGKYRGKILKEFNLSSTRPSMDKVREAIFDMLQYNLADAVVLDLFAGTGALGVEALSRGAEHVDFVDNSKEAIKIIKCNLNGVEGYFSITNADYMQYLKNCDKQYNIILLDPPYATDYGINALKYIIDNNLLADEGTIIFETSKNAQPIFETVFCLSIEQNKKEKYNIPYGGKTYKIYVKHYGLAKVYKIDLIQN